MAEPASSTVGIAIAATTITLTGSILGVQYDALSIGFAGGVAALSFLPRMTWLGVAASVSTSLLSAGLFSPIVAAVVLHYFPWALSLGDGVRLASAGALGIGAQTIIPMALSWLRTKGGQQA